MKKFLLSMIFIGLMSPLFAQSTFFTKADAFFKKNVSTSGKVNYAGIKAAPAELNELVKLVASYQTSGKSSNEKKAFYLNAYNISTIHGIVENYPVKGPMAIKGFFDTKKHTIAGKSITLNHLENKIIRPTYNDARIHFALVCAAKGCPKIANFAFTPAKVNTQLETRTRKAMNDNYFIRVDAGTKKVQYSQLFDWYKADFLKEASSITAYINKYRTKKVGADFGTGTYEYDWNLNKQ